MEKSKKSGTCRPAESEDHGLSRREFLEKSGTALTAAALAGSLSLLPQGCSRRMSEGDYDIIIRNGLVYDGGGGPPRIMDIGVRGDRITGVGKLTGRAARTIDAKGLAVAPGFIDVHTHCDLTFQQTGKKRYLAYVMPSWRGNYNYITQGVTTVVTGNCGYGYARADEWLDIVGSVGFGTNVLHLIPHGMIREELFGRKQPAELSKAGLAALIKRFEEELEKGTVGFSSGLEYAPGCYASTRELIELAKTVRKKGGLYTTHMRDESGRNYGGGKTGIFESVKEAIEIGRRAEIPVQISHLKIAAPIHNTPPEKVMQLIERARMEGLDITADQYPYDAGSTRITILLPNEFVTSDSVKEEFKNAGGKKAVMKAIEKTLEWTAPEQILITMYTGKEEFEGKNLSQIARIRGKEPAECFADMVCFEKQAPVGVFFSQDMRVVRKFMSREYVMTASDGWTVPKNMTRPHPRTYGTFTRKLGHFVMKEKIMTLSAAIRSMTSLPAGKFRIKDRGTIGEGRFADVVVFDPSRVVDRSTYMDPHRYSEGIQYLMVNGIVSISEGKATGKRAGRPITRV